MLSKTSLVVRKANYNVQLNVGNRDDQIMKQEQLFIAFGLRAVALPPSKKKVFSLFESHQHELQDFAKRESLNVSTENDLVRLVEFYNSLQ